MIDKLLVEKKIQELNRCLKELEDSKNISWDEFSSSLGKQWMICHGLQIAIQILIDIGNYILAAIGENQIDDYVDIIDKLGGRNIIPSQFSEGIRGMAGLRNILVHEYARLDLRKIHNIAQNRLDDFYKFITYIQDFLKNN